MRHFDIKRYPRGRGKNLYTTLVWGAIIQGGDYSRGRLLFKEIRICNKHYVLDYVITIRGIPILE